jgi:SAM-dependent methyltransferase
MMPVRAGAPTPLANDLRMPLQAPAPSAEDAGLALTPAFCGVCGDQPAEPAAMTEDFDFRTSTETFLALRCGACGSIYLSQTPTEAASARIYPPAYVARHRSRWSHTPDRGAQALDLGWSAGPEQLERLRQAGSIYHVIRLDLTLEHAPDALELLRSVRAALRPGGRVVALLNNVRSPAFAWFGGRHWGGYDTPRQRRVLSAEGMDRLAHAANLEVVHTTTLSAGEPWVRSFRRLCLDWGAPGWLAARFEDRSVLARGFALLDLALRPLGRSAFLVVTLHAPRSSAR